MTEQIGFAEQNNVKSFQHVSDQVTSFRFIWVISLRPLDPFVIEDVVNDAYTGHIIINYLVIADNVSTLS